MPFGSRKVTIESVKQTAAFKNYVTDMQKRKNLSLKILQPSFAAERIHNSYFSVVRGNLDQEIIHDRADWAFYERKPSYKVTSFDKAVSRDKLKSNMLRQVNENRFSLPDTYDKSVLLTRNHRITHNFAFAK